MNQISQKISQYTNKLASLFSKKNRKKILPLFLTLVIIFSAVSMAVIQRAMLKSQDLRGKAAGPTISKWDKLEVTLPTGIVLSETSNDPNPFLDFRMTVTFTGPGGTYVVPGYFAGDGNGGGTGDKWQVVFTPPNAGAWSFNVELKQGQSGQKIAINPNVDGTTVFQFSDTFNVLDQANANQGFFSKGWLQHTNSFYPQFLDGSYFLKTGADSPENFLGFAGFDNTQDVNGSGTLHSFAPHANDWQQGDPTFGANPELSKNIIGALNYLSSVGVNSIYIVPNTLGGDGWDSYPFVSAENTSDAKSHYDVSKLDQWQIVLEHAQRKGIMVHFVLSELGSPNWWTSDSAFTDERKLYFRELVARFGYLPAVQWNIGEEITNMDSNLLRNMGQYLVNLDWVNRPTGFHTITNDVDAFDPMYGTDNQPFNTASVQFDKAFTNQFVNEIRSKSANAGRPWIVGMDEVTQGVGPDNFDEVRRRVLYHSLFSGASVEWYIGFRDGFPNDITLENFRTYEPIYAWSASARRIMEQNVPYWEMTNDNSLAEGEPEFFTGAQVFTKHGSHYLVYYPTTDAGNNGTLNLSHAGGKTMELKWFDPKTGQQLGSPVSVAGGQTINVSAVAPPPTPGQDLVLLVTDNGYIPPSPTPPPGGGGDSAWIEEGGLVVIEAESGDNPSGWQSTTSIPHYTGESAIIWTGGNFFGEPNLAVAGQTDLKIYINNPGRYHIRVRNHHNHPDSTQENDMWTNIDGEEWVKVYSNEMPQTPPGPSKTWNWQTNYEFSESNKYPAYVDLDAGYHTFSFSGRANGFTIDRIYFFKDDVMSTTDWRNLDHTLPESQFRPPNGIPNPTPTPPAGLSCNQFCVSDDSCKEGLVCSQQADTGHYDAIGAYNLPNSNEVRQIAVRGDYIYARTVNPITNSYPAFTLVPLNSNWYDMHKKDNSRRIAAVAGYNIGNTGTVRQIISVIENNEYEIYYRTANPSTGSYPDWTKISKDDKWHTQTGDGPIRAIGTYNWTPYSDEVKQIVIRGDERPMLYHRIINTSKNLYPDFEYLSDRSLDWYTETGSGRFVDIAAHNINGTNKVREIAMRGTSLDANLFFRDATPVTNSWPDFRDITDGSTWFSQTVYRVCRAEACIEDNQCGCQGND